MSLTYSYDILLGCERSGELVVQACDKTFTSWRQCQIQSLEKLSNIDFPDHFGHPYIRYTSYLATIKIKSLIVCPFNCGKKHYG